MLLMQYEVCMKQVNKYRSKLEARVAKLLGTGWEYEPTPVPYIVKRKYIPDFKKDNLYIEVKGYFRVGDTQKYRAIQTAMLAEGNVFIMILQQPSKPVRKGAKLTMAKWCDKYDIPWESAANADTYKHKGDTNVQ